MASPPDADIPSLMNANEIGDPSFEARAFGRKRGAFGGAHGDFMLPEGRRVADLVRASAVSALHARGYRVVDAANEPDCASLQLTVQRFWSYFRPGAFQVAVHFTAEVRLEGSLPGLQANTLVVDDELRKGAITESRWIELVERGLAELTSRLVRALPPAATAADSSGGEAAEVAIAEQP